MPSHSSLDTRIVLSSPVWPGKKLSLQPGDFNIFIPHGFGMEETLPVRPWDDAFEDKFADYYGYQPRTGNPSWTRR